MIVLSPEKLPYKTGSGVIKTKIVKSFLNRFLKNLYLWKAKKEDYKHLYDRMPQYKIHNY